MQRMRLTVGLLLSLALAAVAMVIYTGHSADAQPLGQDGPLGKTYSIGWVNSYKFPAQQPVCTGVGVVSQFYSGEECGFAVFTISPQDPDKSIEIRYKDQSGQVFHTETAVYDSQDNEYQASIEPTSSWPAGPIEVEAVMQGGDTGSGSTGIFLNTLYLVGMTDATSYAPGQAVTVSGNVYKRTGPSLAPVDQSADATLTVDLLNPSTGDVLATKSTQALGLDGSWSVTFAADQTTGFGTANYPVHVSATWNDSGATFGPSQWVGDLNLVAPFNAGETDLIFTARQTANNGTVIPGELTLYLLTVENPTDAPASNVTVKAALPAGVIFQPGSTLPVATSGSGTQADPLVWSVGDLAAGAQARVYLYAQTKTQAQERTIIWQVLPVDGQLTYTHGGQQHTLSSRSMGPRVVPNDGVGSTVRHGRRPFPVAMVEYSDLKHDASHTSSYFKDQIFARVIDRYLEMSFGQLLPVPVLPSADRGDVTYADTPSATYRWSTLQPNGFCSGFTTAGETGNPVDPNGPPAGSTYRIQAGWYVLPGTQGYYGSDSSASAYAGALSGQGALMNVDNGCNPPGAIAYDAATLMDPDVDYNQFDTDRDGWVDFFELIYQGQPENILGQTGVNNIWPHSSSLEYYYPGGYVSHDQLRNHADQPLFWTNVGQTAMTPTDTGLPVFVKVGPYNVNAEFSDETTFSHEYGHSLGLPDNYTLGSRETMNDWDLMSSGEGHMSIWDKQELGWIVPFPLTSNQNVAAQSEVKTDIQRIEWRDQNGDPYTLTGTDIHNAQVYKVDLPKVQLFDPAIIPSGDWVYYSQAGNDFGYPGHIFDINFDGNLSAGAASLVLQFKSWYQIEVDYDYGYVQISTDGGKTWTNLPSQQGTTRDTNPNGNNQGNGITCVSGAQSDPLCGTVSYPEPVFITDSFDLSAYAGQDFIVRWAYSTDPGLAMKGWVIDDIQLVADGNVIFSDNAEDPEQSRDSAHVYNGWARSNGSGTAEHAYWIGVRDRTGFDAATTFQPGVIINYANESHGYGNVGVDDPPALTVVDAKPEPGSDTPNLDDASWRPFPADPGNLDANNGDVFTDCDNPNYASADGPRHVDNYTDPASEDGNWHFGWGKLQMQVNSLAGEGSGTMTAGVQFQVPAPCPSVAPTATPTATNTPDPVNTATPTPTATPKPTNTPMPTNTPTATNTSVPTATNTPVPGSTNTPTPTVTNTPVPGSTNTPTPTVTNTPVPGSTNTPTPTVTPTSEGKSEYKIWMPFISKP